LAAPAWSPLHPSCLHLPVKLPPMQLEAVPIPPHFGLSSSKRQTPYRRHDRLNSSCHLCRRNNFPLSCSTRPTAETRRSVHRTGSCLPLCRRPTHPPLLGPQPRLTTSLLRHHRQYPAALGHTLQNGAGRWFLQQPLEEIQVRDPSTGPGAGGTRRANMTILGWCFWGSRVV